MKRIAIIGGGIGGLAIANSLQHFKIPFQLYETAPALGEVGAGIGISESTVELFSMLGLKDGLQQNGRYVQDAIIVDKKGNVIKKLPVLNGGFCINRMELVNVLNKKLDQTNIHLNHKLISFDDENDVIKLTFENGHVAIADFVIVADGINSCVRQHFYPEIKKRYSGQTIWRGIAEIELPKKFQNAYLEFWGENLRFASIPMKDKNYYWYAVMESEEGLKDNPEKIKQTLHHLFKNYTKEVGEIINNTKKIIRNDMYDLKPHNKAWHSGNFIFVGDAIHATTPNLAQGGCQAIEDAFCLSLLIHKYGLTEKTFTSFKNLRHEKVNYIMNQSYRYGKISHTKNKLIEFMTQQFFKILPDSYFVKQYKKLIDIEYITSKLSPNSNHL